jgi:HD-like signal output (HDOD) protein/tRNA A-37 threonylcarbamoyl transferase component Bud32
MAVHIGHPDQTAIYTPPPAPDREAVLDRLRRTATLPSPSAIALKVVKETSNPDVTVSHIAELLRKDPVICAKVLKAINSSLYAMPEPVTSVDRAVLLLGLNTLRAIVLTTSLPAIQAPGVPSRSTQAFWKSAVSGAVIGRELAARLRLPSVDDEMLGGLLRDIGQLVLIQHFPAEYDAFNQEAAGRPYRELPELERSAFGVDHAEVSAELLQRWNLPASITEPIRHHHQPAALSGPADVRSRCERLGFIDALANLDQVTQCAEDAAAVMTVAQSQFGMSRQEFLQFLEGVVPKVSELCGLLSTEPSSPSEYTDTLVNGSTELFRLTLERGETASPSGTPVPSPGRSSVTRGSAFPRLPAFQPVYFKAIPPGGCALDEYELRGVLGRGAMGVVFRGYDPALGREVAIKLMLPELARDEQLRRRFIREARSVAAIRHEGVVNVYAVRDGGEVTYLVMELIEGETLDARLQRGGRLPVRDLWVLTDQVAAALEAAHARTIVHRDVKPENILLDAGTNRAKLTDFGLARADEDVKLTCDGGLIGTPLFMAPEQASGRPVDHRADLFSLGATLYMAATGRPPFSGKTTYQVLRQVCESNPCPAHTLRHDLPPVFDSILGRMLAKNPEDRYQSAAAVRAAVRESYGHGLEAAT